MPHITEKDFLSPTAAERVNEVHVYKAATSEASAMTSISTVMSTSMMSTSLHHHGDIPPKFAKIERVPMSEQEKQVDCLVPCSETETDTGYVSPDSRDDSSEHSLFTQLSRTMASNTDEPMMQNPTDDWLEVIAGDNVSVQSMDDNMEDLLYHFDKFFRDRFDGELFRFKNAMYGMLSEQQLHMRRIIHSVEMTSGEENDVTFPDNESSIHENEENVLQDEVIQGNAMCEEKTKSHILLELMSLSCGVTALLNETKYRL